MAKQQSKRRLQRERMDLYRRLVCEAAEAVFAEHGFGGARLDQIAAASGVSIGTIYRVFPNRKREIYRAMQDRHGSAAFDVANARGTLVYQQTGNLVKAMLAGIEASVEYFIAHPAFLQTILREEAAWTIGPRRGNASQYAIWKEAAEQTVTAMQMGIAEGTFVDEDPVAMARTWTAVHQAHLGYWLETGRRQSAAEVNARLRRQLLRSFCRPDALLRELQDPAAMSLSAQSSS
jgi:AcrR family transcriptional regulator